MHIVAGLVTTAIVPPAIKGIQGGTTVFAVAWMALQFGQVTLASIANALRTDGARRRLAGLLITSIYFAMLPVMISPPALMNSISAIPFIVLLLATFAAPIRYFLLARYSVLTSMPPNHTSEASRWSLKQLLWGVTGVAVSLGIARLVRVMPDNPLPVLLLAGGVAILNAIVLAWAMLAVQSTGLQIVAVFMSSSLGGLLLATGFASPETTSVTGVLFAVAVHNLIVAISLAIAARCGYHLVPVDPTLKLRTRAELERLAGARPTVGKDAAATS